MHTVGVVSAALLVVTHIARRVCATTRNKDSVWCVSAFDAIQIRCRLSASYRRATASANGMFTKHSRIYTIVCCVGEYSTTYARARARST